jgi:hypothetical protein
MTMSDRFVLFVVGACGGALAALIVAIVEPGL